MKLQPLPAVEAQALADALPRERLQGVRPRPARLWNWSTWPNQLRPGHGACLSLPGGPAGVFWSERDDFNSDCLRRPVARLHWQLNRRSLAGPDVRTSAAGLRLFLFGQPTEMVSIRVIGEDPVALHLFQQAGARFVGAQLWRYRPPAPVPDSVMPRGFSVRLRPLDREPLPPAEVEELLALAGRCFFPDRFGLDPLVPEDRARERFLRIIANGLRGELANYAVLLERSGRRVGFGFFAATQTEPCRAGDWLTVLLQPELQGRLLADMLVRQAISLLPGGPAHWVAAHSVANFGSEEIAPRLGFRRAAVVYDLHWWKEEQRCAP